MSKLELAINAVSAWLDTLLDAQDGPDPIKVNPEIVPGDQEKFDYKEYEGPVAKKGKGDAHAIDINDVDQGSLGDCYFHAALAAIAKSNPDQLRKIIKDNGDGTYNVTLHVDVDTDEFPYAVDTVVQVTGEFPSKGPNKPAYASNSTGTRDGGELWVMILEKAYAGIEGGYAEIEGGHPGQAMEVLGIDDYDQFMTSAKSAKKIGEAISVALAAKKPVTCYTPDLDKAPEAIRKMADETDIHGNHAYAPISVSGDNITLYNPWGKGNDVTITLTQFKTLYRAVQIGTKS